MGTGDTQFPALPLTPVQPDAIQPDEAPREECGVFGVWAPGEEVAKLTYFGLYALQHRGQEAAGIAVADGAAIVVFKDLGLVSQVFDEQVLSSLHGHIAVGHCRYSTTGSTTWENAQPTFATTAVGSGIALGHNGNLVNTAELARSVAAEPHSPDRPNSTTDSDIVTKLLAAASADSGLQAAAMELLPTLRGAFCLVFCDESTLYAARDAHGIRPLVLGRLDRGWVVASETAALDIVGASFVREVEPGELLAIDADGLRSEHFAPPTPKGCLFEYVYLARPDTAIAGRGVYATRVEIGRRLAVEAPVDADLVIPTPESGTPSAIGYARGLRYPVRPGPGQERLRGPDLHPALADHQATRHPAEAEPTARRHPWQAVGRGGRLDRAGKHPAGPGPDVARGRARSRCTSGSPHRPCAGRASTASTSPRGPN